MAELTQADVIWNRACGDTSLRALPGDRALADMLGAHSLVMNGGVLHAIECLTTSKLSDAKAGYVFFGLDGIASLFTRASALFEKGDDPEVHEVQLDREYCELIPSDDALVERFEKHLESHPSEYAPP